MTTMGAKSSRAAVMAMPGDSPFSKRESEDLGVHVEKCALRYRELCRLLAMNGEATRDTAKRLARLEAALVGGMAVIIGLLAKMAFWPAV